MIKPGQYFAVAPLTQYAVIGHPKLCVEVSKSRVYYRRQFKDDPATQAEYDAVSPEWCQLSSIVFVSDTLEELLEVHAASQAHVNRILAAMKESRVAFDAERELIRAKYKAEGKRVIKPKAPPDAPKARVGTNWPWED